MKILAPAGNFECLKAAVNNGADEVYLGVNDFNARNNVSGFNTDDLKAAVDYAHIYGVKILLAINILFTDEELSSAVEIVVNAYNTGVDAFIVQDLGFAKILSENYPQIELHASTQMGLHNLEGVRAVEKFGFKRIVLARETPLSEVKRISENSDVELEYFVHGALCVSFSGNCYLSSYLFKASGNRGKCKQLCRLPYTFEYKGKKIKRGYLLSAKDFNMSKRLSDLEKAGISVLKIEGRARRSFYVATATKNYRDLLNGKPFNDEQLKLAFNRKSAEGYFNGNGNVISDVQNHIGIEIGKVTKVIKGKKFNEVYFTSDRIVSVKSTLKTFNKNNETATVSAYDLTTVKNGLYKITTKNDINSGDTVRLIVDDKLEKEVTSRTAKINVEFYVTAKTNSPITAEFTVNDKNVTVTGDLCEKAQNHPLSLDELTENFKKSEFFEAKIYIKTLENVFLPKQKLNEFRRNVFAALTDALTLPYRKNVRYNGFNANGRTFKKLENFQTVDNYDQPFTAQKIIYSPCEYDVNDIEMFVQICKNNGKIPYLDTPPFALEHDIETIKDIIKRTGVGIVANNYYALNLTENVVIGAGLNIYNGVAAEIFDRPIITAESDISNRITFPYMTLRHCPMKAHLGATCEKCIYKDGYAYRMDGGKILKLKRKKLSTCTFFLTD